MTSLDDIVTEIRNGIDLEQNDRPLDSDMLPISRIETISEGVIDFSRVKYAAPTLADREKYQLQSGDILFSHINSPEHIGKTALFRSNKPLLHGINLLLLRVDKAVCHPEYLNFYLKSFAVRARFRTRCKKAVNQASLNQDDILSLEVPAPDLPEQKRIAALLEKADRLRRTRRYARQLSDTFLQSVFLKMFGDPLSNPKHWGTDSLRSLCVKFSDGPFGSNLKSSHYTHEGIRVVRLQNIGVGDFIDDDKAFISRSHFADLAKHECVPGDVLIGTLGDPNLRACLLPPSIPLALNKADCVQARVDEKRANRDYVRCLLNIPSTIHLAPGMAHGQTRTRISMGQLAVLPVPVPPLPLQQKFAAIVRRFERLRAQQREAERQADHLFQTLLHRAFSEGM